MHNIQIQNKSKIVLLLALQYYVTCGGYLFVFMHENTFFDSKSEPIATSRVWFRSG